ncbi:MAG: hypothetical protein RLZZ214_2016, partial [Verrucomicrobiota bacterium]
LRLIGWLSIGLGFLPCDVALAAKPKAAIRLDYPDQRLPGSAKTIVEGNTRTLKNDLVTFQFDVTDGRVTNARIDIAAEAGAAVVVDELFALIVNGKPVNASAMKLAAEIREESILADPDSPRQGDHSPAKSFALTFTAPDDAYRVVWKPMLRDDANYLLFDVTVTPLRGDLSLNRLAMLEVTAKKLKQLGTPAGSPVVSDRFFFGFHHPTARSLIVGDHLTFYWDRSNMAVKQGETVHQRAAIGIYPKDQLRRAFNYYLERERSHAYHQVLHYNAWYDILHTARTKKADEAEALERIRTFTRELTVKRGVSVELFMFDDPWDNVSGTATDVWQFDPKRNPNEWKVMKEVAGKYGSSLGVWMSPQGGWGGREVRLATAQKNNLPYVIKDKAFSLSDPAYLARFREVCFDFLRNQGVSMFKFDGLNENPANESEREALVKLIEDMRKEKPDVFINTTCGSWPSPFFLMNSDSIWRGGGDIEMKGVGPVREQSITYRDWTTYMKVVSQSPLFPISSVMSHGVVLAPYVHHKGFDTATIKQWKNDVRSYFAIGVNLQELYIAPNNQDTGEALMTDELWDIVAEGAKWSRANEDVLVDSHWVGGNPGEQQVYGVAAWLPTKATLMLRNPSNQPQLIAIDPEKAFELPQHENVRTFTMKSPWADQADKPAVTLTAGKAHTFKLEPFEVIVLERE